MRAPWGCGCGHQNVGDNCTNCGLPWNGPGGVAPAPDPLADDPKQKVQTLFHFAHTKACVDENDKPAVAIVAEGNVYAFVMSPRNAMSLALGLIEAANNAVTNTMLFASLTASGVSEADAGRMVTAYTAERRHLLREER